MWGRLDDSAWPGPQEVNGLTSLKSADRLAPLRSSTGPNSEIKRCYRCRQARPLAGFIRKRNGTTYSMCSACLGEILSAPRPTRKARLKHTESERTCYLCRRSLPVSRFTRRSNGTYFSACKDCNVNVFAHRRRARMAEADGTFTTAEWEALKDKYDRCPECSRLWGEIPVLPGKKSAITRDHIIPISKGGRNDISNLRPLCYSCNSRKGDRCEAERVTSQERGHPSRRIAWTEFPRRPGLPARRGIRRGRQ